MKVAIDVWHTRQTAAGTARYSRSLADAIRARGDTEVIEIGGGPTVRPESLGKKLLTLEQDLFWYPFEGRRKAMREGADVYHCPAMRAPFSRGRIPLVVTVHDLVALRFPETMPSWTRMYTRATLRRTLDAADLIITPSADTANDLEQLADVAAAKIRVIWNGVSELFFGPAEVPRGIREPYVLFVGTLEPRKNLARLIQAVALLREKGLEHRLVVAGGRGWGAAIPAPDFVEMLGAVADDELHSLYANAACTVLPSLHEGFGLPAVESMAAGAPVVAARSGALPEITGDAAILVDPMDSASIASGIFECIKNRDAFAAKGRARAKLFRWSMTAEKTVEAYRSLL
jgi:glycosyltransferase involved in cell wall biosynthesis